MYADLRHKVYTAIQSDAKIFFSTLKFGFSFLTIPSGSGNATTSREKENVLEKKSVNCIQNKDKNCFWHALAVLVHANHKRIKEIKNGPKNPV